MCAVFQRHGIMIKLFVISNFLAIFAHILKKCANESY